MAYKFKNLFHRLALTVKSWTGTLESANVLNQSAGWFLHFLRMRDRY